MKRRVFAAAVALCLAGVGAAQPGAGPRTGMVIGRVFDAAQAAPVEYANVVLHTLDRAKAERPGNLPRPLHKMAEHFKRRGILVLISDLYEEPDAILEAIKPLKFLGNDVIVFHVLDPAELDFGYEDAASFEDLESGEQIPVVPESLAQEYRSLIQAHISALTTRFSEHRIDYTVLNTSEPLDRALFSYLSSRERLMRVR